MRFQGFGLRIFSLDLRRVGVLRKYSRYLFATFAPTNYAPAGEVTIQYS